MNGKFVGLAAVAAALVVAAGLMLTRGAPSADATRSAFLPSFKDDLTKVTRVELHRGDQNIELDRKGDDWSLASAGGYPAKVDGVRGIMTGLVGLEIDEPMTSKRERHGELGLAWPDAKGEATLVRVLDAEEKALYEIVLGQEKYTPPSLFVRRLAEDQTYRCRGSVRVDPSVRNFVDTEVVSLKADDIESIGYDALILTRDENKVWKAEFGPSPIDESTWPEEQRTAAAQALPQWIARIDFDNVRRRDREGATWTADPAFTITYFAKAATVTVEGSRDGEAVWIRVSATPVEGAMPPKAEPAAGAEPAKPDDATSFDWSAWNGRVGAWEFKLPEWKTSAIKRIREAKPAPTPAGLPSPAPSFPPAGS